MSFTHVVLSLSLQLAMFLAAAVMALLATIPYVEAAGFTTVAVLNHTDPTVKALAMTNDTILSTRVGSEYNQVCLFIWG